MRRREGCARLARTTRTMVFFDVGDTLLERARDEATCIMGVLDDLGMPPEAALRRRGLEAMAHAYRVGLYAAATRGGEDRLWRSLALACLRGWDGGGEDAVAALARVLAGYAAWYRPVAGMLGLLADLRAAAVDLGVVSNWPPSLADLLERHGFGGFPVLACSGVLRCTKPDLQIFRWALERAGVSAATCWHIGDDPECDYRPATALGLRAVLWDPRGRHRGAGMRRAGDVSQLRGILGL